MEDASTFALVARTVFSLAIVVGLMAIAGRMLRKRGLGGSGSSPVSRVEVLSRHGLGRTAQVAVVRAGGKTLILGVTEHQVNVLAEADPVLMQAEAALAEADENSKGATDGPGKTEFPPFVEWLRELTTRRS